MTIARDAVRDVRHGLRVLAHSPAFAAAALLTLALCIGATSAIFSIVRTVMLAPLPYREPERIVTVWETNRGGAVRNVISAANFVAWRERTRTLEHLGMVGPAGMTMTIAGQPIETTGLTVSADTFLALGVQPTLGRVYTADEDFSGNQSLIVLSHEFWQRRLAGRADVLGLTLSTDGGPRTVIGVMPPSFTVVGQKADFLMPYGLTLDAMRTAQGRGSSYAIARLRDGVSVDQAFRDMRGVYAQLEKEEPRRNARRTVMVLRLQEQMVGEIRPALYALAGAVALVLLVGCVNVANLLLARGAAREREIGLRTALGAERARLVRQMLAESLVLAAAGGLAGLGVAVLCHRGLLALVGDRIPVPRIEQLALDVPVVAFTCLVSVATGLVFGVVPALISTSRAHDALRDGGRHGGGRRVHRALAGLVVAEVALSLVLLTGAGLLMRSVIRLQETDVGFRVDGVLTATVPLPPVRYDAVRADRVFRDALSRIAALPGVQDAAGAACLPVPFACIGTSFWRADRARPADGQVPSAHVRPVTPGFFRTLQIPLRAGRDFTDGDTAESVPVAVVSEELVRAQFPDGVPIGRRLRVNVDHADGRSDVEWTVVGVVGNTRSALDGPVRQTIYIPRSQRPSQGMTVFVRTANDPMTLASAVTATVQAIEPEAPVRIATLEEVIGHSVARPRAIAILLAAFALLAVVLSAVGVYGVMSYAVRARTQEIGVRVALGATPPAVLRLVLGHALRLILAGIAVGLVAAAMLTRVLRQLLFGVEALDPWTFASTALILLVVATIASWVPARRSLRLAPNEALRVTR
jgi:putative ABC transport system permease protein